MLTQSPPTTIMDTPRHMPLQDLPLEQFHAPAIIPGSKTSRKHKRPLSPSHTTPLNPAKRRVLDAEGILSPNNAAISSRLHPVPFMLSMHTVTPTRPSRLGNGYISPSNCCTIRLKCRARHIHNYGRSQGTHSPLSSQRLSSPCEIYPRPTVESSTDPQSRHYPGFNIFRDSERRRGSPSPSLPSHGNALVDKSEEDKENVPLRRKAKKLSSKKRLLSGLDGSDCPTTPAQTSKMVDHVERMPFAARQALR
ncbi:hypothetical protein V8E55_001863 [Tylopilus felleus]